MGRRLLSRVRTVIAPTMLIAALLWLSPASAACTWKFDWYCSDCAKIGGRTTGEQGGYPSEAACESARSQVRSPVSAMSCDRVGWCDEPRAVRPVPPSGNTVGGGGHRGPIASQPDYSHQNKMAEQARQAEAARAKAEAERKAREQAAFAKAKADLLGDLKGSTLDRGRSLKGVGDSNTLDLKSGTPTFGIKANPSGTLQLKKPAEASAKPDKNMVSDPALLTKPPLFSKGSKNSAPVVAESRAVGLAQGRLETRDPVWLKNIRNEALQTARSERKFVDDLRRSFRANEPPKPEAIRSLGALKAGEIILVNSEKPGGLADLVQGFLDRKISDRPDRAPVSHAFVYLGKSGSHRLFLDNQLGEGPRIIGETELRQRYGHRQLFTARPTMPIDGTALFRAAADYARSNEAAINRGHGLLGTKYGVFGKDNFVCSETSLFAVARASNGALDSLTHDLRAKKKFDIIKVTPGDIYDQDGLGYFTVRSLQLDGSRAKH